MSRNYLLIIFCSLERIIYTVYMYTYSIYLYFNFYIIFMTDYK